MPKASAGCGKGAGAPTVSNSLVSVPTGYDGTKPVPVIFAFHAAGNTNTQLKNEYGSSNLAKNYMMIYLQASGGTGGWDIGKDKARFNTAVTDVLANGCVDENRLYATGHSSGSQFLEQLLCAGETRFRAVAPVASSVYCSKWTAVAALVIHGTNDQERTKYGLNDGDGKKDIVPYTTSDGCSSMTMPSTIDVAGCSASIHPNCVDFQGCSKTVTWCNHDDPNYSGTNHGIPCFAKAAIFDFFETEK
jgi:poly(3-hydroxybutyrate) depolymerase